MDEQVFTFSDIANLLEITEDDAITGMYDCDAFFQAKFGLPTAEYSPDSVLTADKSELLTVWLTGKSPLELWVLKQNE
ncbi:hypothetical protein NIES4101_33930 [Calothrix sp. NIES-4101]|nr:hypothetical protein NIES4101_33930 [Calothrix sp. NIES-4101]